MDKVGAGAAGRVDTAGCDSEAGTHSGAAERWEGGARSAQCNGSNMASRGRSPTFQAAAGGGPTARTLPFRRLVDAARFGGMLEACEVVSRDVP